MPTVWTEVAQWLYLRAFCGFKYELRSSERDINVISVIDSSSDSITVVEAQSPAFGLEWKLTERDAYKLYALSVT
ncbi:hypothetical protein TNCV_1629081 [Trichonephila clavipes]|uniref:Uncharacterized protein n=1 Tax=Trichonephila clavipes TaxID=2585209 RepID=A0A8X7BHS2_TRICX|nr:hypothetical protein TNCV_1629081 [Trichonephila clavipes]